MVGATLHEIRREIERLADDDGTYRVRCGRTGVRPVPVDGLAFPDRETAAAAAELAEQYRAALRRYDPQVPCYDPIVCEGPALVPATERPDGALTGRDAPGDPAGVGRSDRVEFCHRLAGALFEALSRSAHENAERAVMDAYLEAAESVADRDELCLVLLEQIAVELDRRLADEAVAALFERALTTLPALAPSPDRGRCRAAFDRLAALGFLEGYAVSDESVDVTGGTRSWTVLVRDYPLVLGDLVVTLPITADLTRRCPDGSVSVERATRQSDRTCRFTLVHAPQDPPAGVLTAPVGRA